MRDIVRLKTEKELVRIKIINGNAFWNEIGVNAGVSKLMLLTLNLLLPVLVYAARHSLTTVRHKLMLLGITYHCLKVLANMKREGKGFSGRITPLFQTMMVQAPEDMGEDSAAPIDSHSTPLNYISTSSCDPPQSVEDRLKLVELMTLCTKLQKQVLDLEEAKTAQAKEFHFKTSECIALEEEKDFKRLHGSRADLDADAEVTLIDETQERNDERCFLLHNHHNFHKQKNKGKGKMVEPEKPLKKKDQIALDEELALRLRAEEQAELEKESVAHQEASREAIIE
ncbi:hypothetical protein Tco_0487808 [Tanacetum coccineum]